MLRRVFILMLLIVLSLSSGAEAKQLCYYVDNTGVFITSVEQALLSYVLGNQGIGYEILNSGSYRYLRLFSDMTSNSENLPTSHYYVCKPNIGLAGFDSQTAGYTLNSDTTFYCAYHMNNDKKWQSCQIEVVPRGINSDVNEYDFFIGFYCWLFDPSNVENELSIYSGCLYIFAMTGSFQCDSDGSNFSIINTSYGMPFSFDQQSGQFYTYTIANNIYSIDYNTLYKDTSKTSVTSFCSTVSAFIANLNSSLNYINASGFSAGSVCSYFNPLTMSSQSWYSPILNYLTYDYDVGGMPDYMEFQSGLDRTDPDDDWTDVSDVVELGENTRDFASDQVDDIKESIDDVQESVASGSAAVANEISGVKDYLGNSVSGDVAPVSPSGDTSELTASSENDADYEVPVTTERFNSWSNESKEAIENHLEESTDYNKFKDLVSPLASPPTELPSWSISTGDFGTFSFNFNELKSSSYWSTLQLIRSIAAFVLYLFAFVAFLKEFKGFFK